MDCLRWFGNEPGVQKVEFFQAGSSQHKSNCASPMLSGTGLGSNS